MAGEWIPYDVCLPQKPEVIDLVDRTGLENATVCGRLQALWGWASLNSSDGTARISIRLLSKVCGGDESFWYAVQDVGWLVIDADAGTVAIPGWDRRFSKSAKSRHLGIVRHQVDKAGGAERPQRGRRAPPRGAPRALDRGDREERSSSSSSPVAAPPEEPGQPDGPEGWETLRTAWRAGKGRPWSLPDPPAKLADRLAEPGWFEKALAAIDALPRCRYFADPVTLPQLVGEGFVDKVLGGQFDNPRRAASAPPGGPGDRPPAQGWSGDDLAAFEATKAALAAKIREGAA